MNHKIGILLKLTAMFAFTVMSACVKGLEGAIPIGEVVFFRAFFALWPLCIWLKLSPQPFKVPARNNLPSLLAASLAGLGGMFFGFLALVYLPLVNVTVLSYTTPLFTIILAAILLREKVLVYRWVAVLVGFLGILLTLAPSLAFPSSALPAADGNTVMFGTVLALTGALCAAFSSIAISRLARIEQPACIVLSYTLTGVVVGLATFVLGWKMPDTTQWMLLAGVGLAGGMGQITMTLSLRHAQASLLAPFEYSNMIWAMALGYAFMSEIPTSATIAGALMVIIAGLFATWRENRSARRFSTRPAA